MHPHFTGYAESPDGIHWTQPNLGLVSFDGVKDNNLLAARLTMAFKDTNPAAKPEARYKGISLEADDGGQNIGGGRAVYAWQSEDGIHWQMMQDAPIYDKSHRGLADLPAGDVLTWLDSRNMVFWSPEEQCYVMYYRVYTCEGELQTPDWERPADYNQKRVREAEKAVSDDFLHWRRFGLITCTGDFPSVQEQMYSTGIAPYYRAPHIYIGLPNRYTDRGWTGSHDHLPDLERRKLEWTAAKRAATALTDTLLMWSRDGENFQRSPETFVTPGPERPGSWMYGDHELLWPPVETKPTLEGAAPELSFYSCEYYRKRPAVQVRRHTLRLDGFASLHANRDGGGFTTRPLTFNGERLTLNAATSVAGAIRVEIQHPDGSSIPGFALDDCDEVIGDDVDRTVTWLGNSDVVALAGQPVRLRFSLCEADLFSIRFASDK